MRRRSIDGRGGWGVGGCGLRDEGASAKEVPGRRDVVARLVPEVGEAEEAEVSEVNGTKKSG